MDTGKINYNLLKNIANNIPSQPSGQPIVQSADQVSEESFEERLKSAMEKKDDKELKKVCQQFEGIMLNMLYKQMKATVPKSELIPGDAGREVFESMLDDKLVEEASKRNQMGLADALYKQLSRSMNTVRKPENKNSPEEVEPESSMEVPEAEENSAK